MHLQDRYTIIFNGEIYNHQELRTQLNIKATTSSDTETLLLLYQQLGTAMLQQLDGMFAFAIYDNAEKTLFMARDRAGKKPLYYYNDGQKFVFASELNCLKELLPLQADENNIAQYLRLGSFYKQLTPYKKVAELNAGCYLMVNCNTLSIAETKWWNVAERYAVKSPDSFATSLEKVDEFLHTTVRRRVESSDLEVGSFLSGGIDSGLVTAIASKYNKQLRTFTVCFEGAYNEAPLAALVAAKYNTRHTEINISFDHLVNDVEQILCNYGEPFFDSSAIPSYYVSKEARKSLTVILNGDGADELFGGYRRYVPFAKYDFFKSNAFVKGFASGARKLLPPSSDKKSTYNYLYRLASLASKTNLQIYLSAGVDIFEDFEDKILKSPGESMLLLQNDFSKIANSNTSGLSKLMNMDFDTTLFSDLLVKMDIANMANSLEGRSPFLGKELLEYVPGLQDDYKIHGTTTKYLLRELAKRYLPDTLIHQPKRGFEIPLKSWVDNELKALIFDYLSASDAVSKQYVDARFIADLMAQKVKIPAEKRAKILWTLFSLEVWYKKVYNGN